MWKKISSWFSTSAQADSPPPEESGFTPEAKSGAEIAKRFVLVVTMAELADGTFLEAGGDRSAGKAIQTRALDRLVAMGLGPGDLESRESQFALGVHQGRVDQQWATATAWRLECAQVLAWALGLAELLPVDAAAELAPLIELLPADAAGFRAFCDHATPRPLAELLTANGQWCQIFFPLEPAPPSEERSRAIERVRALRWLVEPDLVELSSIQVVQQPM